MMKYILCIFFSSLLMLGFSHIFNKELHKFRIEAGITHVRTSQVTRHIPDTFIEQPSQDNRTVRHGDYDYKIDNGIIGNTSFSRNNLSSKTLRLHSSILAIQILSSFNSLLPEKKRKGSSFYTNPAQHSYRYFIYTLKHILI